MWLEMIQNLLPRGWTGCLDAGAAANCQLQMQDGWLLLAALGVAWLGIRGGRRLFNAVYTLRAAALTPVLSRRLSMWVKRREYDEDAFFRADGAASHWAERRQKALDRLSTYFQTKYAKSVDWGNDVRDSFSDLRFTDANRVPFPFMKVMREKFNLCSVVTASKGPKLRDLDGHWSLDVGGSYGVNVAGFERYKEWMRKGLDRVRDVGPVLGPLHPLVADNIALLKSISGLDEVSFHMSGTEAVMAAVRLARFNTRRKLVVAFSGAYHGWWDGVQPGLGSERAIGDCLTLKDMHPASLDVIRRRAKDIAGVLVNPVQSFHPNAPPPSDAVLLTSAVRQTQDGTSDYARWLQQLREVCRECDVPLIFDEVYSGFRLAPGGAQAHFGVQADMVAYGKTVAGGMPIGVVCGRKDLMRRFDPRRPMRIAYVIGTFSAHPAVMGAMHEFLTWLGKPEAAHLYEAGRQRCQAWADDTNAKFIEHGLPLRVVNFATIWTLLFKTPSRYNWLLQYYLRAEGVTLSWVGTGRCLSSLDFTPDDYADLQSKILSAARQMKEDAWWLEESEQPERDKRMRVRLIWELIGSLVSVPKPVSNFYAEVMRRKHDDHVASHSNAVNQLFHILSSSVFIYCYVLTFSNLTTAMGLGLAALFVRQFGHAVLEPPCHDKEEILLGFNTRKKSVIVGAYLLIPVVHLLQAGSLNWAALAPRLDLVAQQWFGLTVLVVGWHVGYLMWKHNVWLAMIWFVKLATDPFTDLVAYSPPYLTAAKALIPSRTNKGR